MFKIKVNTLPESGLKIEQPISSEGLNQRLNESPNSEKTPIKFTSDIDLSLLCEKAAHGMTLTGTIKVKCKQQCGLCAEEPERLIKASVMHVFKYHSELPLPEDDVGVSYYNSEQVELIDCLEELLLLQISPFWHPDIDESGKCSLCAKNPRQSTKIVKIGTQNLGDALKKAGLT